MTTAKSKGEKKSFPPVVSSTVLVVAVKRTSRVHVVGSEIASMRVGEEYSVWGAPQLHWL